MEGRGLRRPINLGTEEYLGVGASEAGWEWRLEGVSSTCEARLWVPAGAGLWGQSHRRC